MLDSLTEALLDIVADDDTDGDAPSVIGGRSSCCCYANRVRLAVSVEALVASLPHLAGAESDRPSQLGAATFDLAVVGPSYSDAPC